MKLLISACLCLFFFSQAKADPLLVTSGSVTPISPGSIGSNFLFAGSNFTLIGGLNQGRPLGVTGPVNSILEITITNAGLDIRNGSGVIDGISFPSVFYSGTLTLRASVFFPLFDGSASRVLTAPFTLEGAMQGCTVSEFASPCAPQNVVFGNTPIFGVGFAEFLVVPGSGQFYDIRSVTFTFQPAEAIPEPSSILLLASGFGLLWGTARRFSRRAQRH